MSSVQDRLQEHSSASGECTVYTGYTDKDGYGYMKIDGRNTPAHRAAYAEAHGPIPEGLVIRHKCDNPPCVKLDHLEIGTNEDNVRDRTLRDRAAHGEGNSASKLSEQDVLAIRQALMAGSRQQPLADQYGVSQAAISRIKTGRYWVRAGRAAA